jgi:hypothetical protein
MAPECPLPLPADFHDAETYVKSLLKFSTTSMHLQTLCGGVHILDFFTRKPDLYTQILPETWRNWFKSMEIPDVLDFLMREDLEKFCTPINHEIRDGSGRDEAKWRNVAFPPQDLVDYVKEVRRHLLDRSFQPRKDGRQEQNKKILVGMNAKKAHEVQHFAQYISALTTTLNSRSTPETTSNSRTLRKITHLVDFGAGQNYLGRALASHPYNRHIIAIESRPHVVEGAKKMDVMARLTEREEKRVNKKAWREKFGDKKRDGKRAKKAGLVGLVNRGKDSQVGKEDVEAENEEIVEMKEKGGGTADAEKDKVSSLGLSTDYDTSFQTTETSNYNSVPKETIRANLEVPTHGQGSVQYVEHRIIDGNLAAVIDRIECLPNLIAATPKTVEEKEITCQEQDKSTLSNLQTAERPDPPNAKNQPEVLEESNYEANENSEESQDPSLMVISLHSCGNLLHHGLRTITLNPSVQAVALVGCCYNLVTERLGATTYKIPGLRADHPRLEATGNSCDEHGFPMSERFMKYQKPVWRWAPEGGVNGGRDENGRPNKSTTGDSKKVAEERKLNNDTLASEETILSTNTEQMKKEEIEEGIRLNITARMMALQAPQNWSEIDSESFFTRHFYRALLQRIFLDKGVIKPPTSLSEGGGRSAAGTGDSGSTAPIIIGTMSKKCYVNFVAYIRGAVAKIVGMGSPAAALVKDNVGTMSDDEILRYEESFRDRKKELSVVWTLMAFSAGVIEALVVVDRWLWLTEQDSIEAAWVETVFEYAKSPRNMVIVGIKKERN